MEEVMGGMMEEVMGGMIEGDYGKDDGVRLWEG